MARAVTLKLWQVLLVGLVILLVGVAIGAGGKSGDKTTSVTADTTTTEVFPISSEAPVAPPTLPPTPPPTTAPPTAPPPTAPAVAPTPPATAPADPVELGHYVGDSDRATDSFRVKSPFRVSWTVTGGYGMNIKVREVGAASFDYESINVEPGTSNSVIRKTCECYLDLSTFGATYDITVTGVPG